MTLIGFKFITLVYYHEKERERGKWGEGVEATTEGEEEATKR